MKLILLILCQAEFVESSGLAGSQYSEPPEAFSFKNRRRWEADFTRSGPAICTRHRRQDTLLRRGREAFRNDLPICAQKRRVQYCYFQKSPCGGIFRHAIDWGTDTGLGILNICYCDGGSLQRFAISKCRSKHVDLLGDREKPEARLIASASVSMEGCQRDSIRGRHSRPTSASPPSQPPVFPSLQKTEGGKDFGKKHTDLYDRTNDQLTLDEIDRIVDDHETHSGLPV